MNTEMIFIDCKQGTPEWMAARAGVTTASFFAAVCKEVGGLNEQQAKYVNFIKAGETEKDAATLAGYKAVPRSEIIARAVAGEKTTDYSDEAKRYAYDLSLERISEAPYGAPVKVWMMERGHEMEELARVAYEAQTGQMVTESGLILTPDRKFGYSTDGLVNHDGLIEVKAPVDSQKIFQILRTGDLSEYEHQMQGGMWITGRKWCDFIMYVPALEKIGKHLYIKRVYRDENFIDSMVERLVDFDSRIDQNVAFARFMDVLLCPLEAETA